MDAGEGKQLLSRYTPRKQTLAALHDDDSITKYVRTFSNTKPDHTLAAIHTQTHTLHTG